MGTGWRTPMMPRAAPRQFLALVVDDADVKTRRRLAHRARPDRKQFRVAADHEIAFGLAEHFMGVDAEGRAHPVQQFAAERLAAGKDAAQPDALMFDVGLPHQFQRGRRQEHVADAVVGHDSHRRLRLEFSRAMTDDRHAVIPGREQRVDQAADPGPVGRRPHQVAGLWQEIVAHLDIGQMAEHHAMRMQRALRVSRGARGVDDQGGIVGRGIDGGKVRGRRLQRGPERFCAGMRGIADDIDMFQFRQPVADFSASPTRPRR